MKDKRKRDAKGRVVQRVPGVYSDRIFNFRVTEDELSLIKKAINFGLIPRDAVLKEAQKVLKNEKID